MRAPTAATPWALSMSRNMEQIHGVFRGADQAQAPIIVQFTRVIRKYAHPLMLEKMLQAAELFIRTVQFCGPSRSRGRSELQGSASAPAHYGSVMIDASHHPFEENVAITTAVVEDAHAAGIAVEAEFGQLKGIEDGMEVERARRHSHRSGTSGGIRATHRVRQPGRGHWHQPRRLQVRRKAAACTWIGSPRFRRDLPGLPAGAAWRVRGAERAKCERINAAGGTLGQLGRRRVRRAKSRKP